MATTTPATEVEQLEDLVDQLIRDHDPATTDPRELRAHRYDRGLAWVHFPEGWGGLGLRPELQRVVEPEAGRAGAKAPTEVLFFGLALAGPTVVTHGSDEVRARLLRPMFTGEEVWCQLFSEPGAGPTSPASPAGPNATATSGWSTARRCGTRWPTWPTGACSSPAPTPTCPSTRA